MNKVALSILLCSSAFTAQASDPHVHGKADMDLVYSENEIHMEFRSPMANLLGFEYKPQSKVEIFKYKEALTTLKDTHAIQFSGISCQPEDLEIDAPWEELTVATAKSDEAHHEHDHDEHTHEHHHDKYEHNDHHEKHEHDKHEHDDHHDEHDHDREHADITVKSHYKCEAPSSEINIEFSFVKAFPKLEALQVNWITDSLQGSVQVTPDMNKIVLE